MKREALTKKVMVLGVDAMDPALTRKFVDEGYMPNTKKLIERGACREDLIMLGGQPTVTPPMWTTMATGCNPNVHGITCFFRQSHDNLAATGYNLDSRNCTAEPFWNVSVEAGKKTLVFHWPGSSWPPTSDSPLLHVVDGTQPPAVNMGVGSRDNLFVAHGSVNVATTTLRPRGAFTGHIPCVIEDMQVEETNVNVSDAGGTTKTKALSISGEASETIMLTPEEGEGGLNAYGFDAEVCAIKPATGWSDAPDDAMESSILLSGGLIRRPLLILKNEQGIYDHIAIYKSKKDMEPIVVLENDVYTTDIVDEAIKDDQKYTVARSMRLLSIQEDGTDFVLFVSGAMDTACDLLFHPRSLYKDITENIGYPAVLRALTNKDKDLMLRVNLEGWRKHGKWQADSINYLIEKEGYEVVFSHFHFVDTMGHLFFKLMNGTEYVSKEDFSDLCIETYKIADEYIGEFLPLLDDGWTIILVSDHAQVCPEHHPHLIGDMTGVNVPVMRALGYTTMVKDENGNDTHTIDWSKTKAIASRGNHIYLNLKSRWDKGIIEPEDQYEVEEQLMTDLYGYRDNVTGKRIIALALRNRDAVLLGMGGPECGDILFWTAEGYNYDHCDSLSTTLGTCGTSVSPIFIAAGPGIKEGFTTTRIIRQVDVVPTIAVLTGLRMPTECEGAPAYQILSEQF